MDFEELKKRTKDFAHRCVKLALALPATKLGRHIAFWLEFIIEENLLKKESVLPLFNYSTKPKN